MSTFSVDFPEEADNTQFVATPQIPLIELQESIAKLFMREDEDGSDPVRFDFLIENELFSGLIRLLIQSKEYLTTESEEHPMLFYLSGPAILLDELGNETDLWLQAGGQLDLSNMLDSAPTGVLTVWRPNLNIELEALDAS